MKLIRTGKVKEVYETIKIGYHKKSMTTRKKGTIESAMLPLPENIIKYVNSVYINLFRKIL